MKVTEILRLVWLNLSANKSKVILTSTGIIVGAATIMLVIAIGTGGKEEVAEQFKNLNAGAIDISYEYQGNSGRPGGGSGMPGGGGGMPGGAFGGSGGFSFGGGMFMMDQSQSNSERITLSESDMEDLETFVPGIARTTMSFSTTSAVDGGELESSTSYTIAGVLSNYAGISNLEMALGDFLTDENNTYKEKVCVLGSNVAKTVFGSVYDAYDGTVYIDNRPYQVSGIISEMGTVASGISPDDAISVSYTHLIELHQGSKAFFKFFFFFSHFIIGIVIIIFHRIRIFIYQLLRFFHLFLQITDLIRVLFQGFLISIGSICTLCHTCIIGLLCGYLFFFTVQKLLSVIQRRLNRLLLQFPAGRLHAFIRKLQNGSAFFHLIP